MVESSQRTSLSYADTGEMCQKYSHTPLSFPCTRTSGVFSFFLPICLVD